MGILVNATNEQIDFGSDASLDDISAGTYILWGYFNSVATDGQLIVKSAVGSSATHLIIGSANDPHFNINRATTDLTIESNTNPLQTSQWNFVACHWDFNGANGDQQIYWGDLTTTVAEVGGYLTQRVGAGARTSDAGNLSP
jgi:hypothetical protein